MIDLGTQPLGHTLPFAELDADRTDFLVDSLSIVELPVVLDVFPRYDSFEKKHESLARGHAGLVQDNLIVDGFIHPDLEAWLRILEQPRWYVSARRVHTPYTEDSPILRICLAGNSTGTVIATKAEGRLRLRIAAADAAVELFTELGSGRALEFRGVSAPTDGLAEALDAAPTDSGATASRLAHLGIDGDVAREVASAISMCSAQAEITSVTVESGNRSAGAHPVAFFDTPRGRIAATSSRAADGSHWTTLSPGTDTRITAALSELIGRAL